MSDRLLAAALAAVVSLLASRPAAAVETVSQRLYPLATGQGTSLAPFPHYVAVPRLASERKNILVVFLPGSTAQPSGYTQLADYAASLGFGVLDLSYFNAVVVGGCQANVTPAAENQCYTQFRGETLFGQNVAYGGGPYDSSLLNIDAANSIVGRIVSALDYLAHAAPALPYPDPPTTPIPVDDHAYWLQFVASTGPYATQYRTHATPVWSKIILAGHSQGGGNAAFAGMHLPNLRRVVMFSAPNDETGGLDLILGGSAKSPATWLLQPSATSLANFFGFVHAKDTRLGPAVERNWQVMGGHGVGNEGYSDATPVGDGSGTPGALGPHKLRMTVPANPTPVAAHNCTAASDASGLSGCGTGRTRAWKYLLTGGYVD